MANSTVKLTARYGAPPFSDDFKTPAAYLKALAEYEERIMVSWDIPNDINQALPCLPNRLYCNKDLTEPFEAALRDLIAAYRKGGVLTKLDSLVTFDGCYNIRKKRGLSSISTHAWAISVDLNAFRNGLGKTPTFTEAFAKIFEKHGFIWGGRWSRKDGMHFELDTSKLPAFCPCN